MLMLGTYMGYYYQGTEIFEDISSFEGASDLRVCDGSEDPTCSAKYKFRFFKWSNYDHLTFQGEYIRMDPETPGCYDHLY